MSDVLTPRPGFRSLSIKDLLEARDLYHYHLMNRSNVVGTAIGLYLIRKWEPYPRHRHHDTVGAPRSRTADKEPRTLGNSEVRDYSWPSVLVFVRDWVRASRFGAGAGRVHPDEMVPRRLYLPDGRMVPICVVMVEPAAAPRGVPPTWRWPRGPLACGMPLIVEPQNRESRATVGCLVSDGHTLYALTSRHVCGEAREPVYTMVAGRRECIGHASPRHLSRLPFTRVYPEFAGRRTWINLDVGLIELDDAKRWSSQVVDLGATGALADLNSLNITLRLIDAPVVASGAASGRMEGRIKALFYRYKSVGGYDYVSDLAIVPKALEDAADAELDARRRKTTAPPHDRVAFTQPGDSGAVWHLVVHEGDAAIRSAAGQSAPPDRDAQPRNEFEGTLRPLALEWGGQAFVEAGGGRYAFALATSLTTVCSELNVELVLEHNTGARPYWGQFGHYSIAAAACAAVNDEDLRKCFDDNLDSITFPMDPMSTPKEIAKALSEAKKTNAFVPLADVPDTIWKNHVSKVEGGRDTKFAGKGRTTGPEHPAHYADMDAPRPSDGETLRSLCEASDANVSVSAWKQFYDDRKESEPGQRGLLPFRAWQIFDELVRFAAIQDVKSFLCGAGILAHYVADACQPLHGSQFADGYPDKTTTVTHKRRATGEEYEEEVKLGAGVHSAYETAMIDRRAREFAEGMAEAADQPLPEEDLSTGKGVAKAILALMGRTADALQPQKIVDAYVAAGGRNIVAVQEALWEKFGDATIAAAADGAKLLARIWDSAWALGKTAWSSTIKPEALGRFEQEELRQIYIRTDFLESLYLDEIEKELADGSPLAGHP